MTNIDNTTPEQRGAMVKQRYIMNKTPMLPNRWNKDGAHDVQIATYTLTGSVNRLYSYGYIWASDNWVEIHCFDGKNNKKEYWNTGKTGGHWRTFPNWSGQGECIIGEITKYIPQYELGEKNIPVFYGHQLSAIIERKKIRYDSSRNRIDAYFDNETDLKRCIKRWHDWHPENDYRTELRECETYNYYWKNY